MKNIIKLFSLILVFSLTIVSCEEEAEWFGDYNGGGDVYAQFSDTNFDFGLFLDANGVAVTEDEFPVYVKLLGPAQSGDTKVGIKITESTGASGEWTMANRVATIPAGELTGMVMVKISKDNAVIDSTYMIKLAIDEATSDVPAYGNVASTATVTVMKGLSCALDYTMFTGDFYYKTVFDYDPNPATTVTPDADEDVFAISTIWDEMGPCLFELEVGGEKATNQFTVTGADQDDVWSGDLTSWGLSDDCDFDFTGFNNGTAFSCTGEFSINFTPYLSDNGAGATYWWGGEITLEFVPGTPGKKASTSMKLADGSTPKLVRIK